MANEKTRLKPKWTAAPGGRFSEIVVSADASRLFVFHDDESRVTVLETARLNILGHDLLGPGSGRPLSGLDFGVSLASPAGRAASKYPLFPT